MSGCHSSFGFFLLSLFLVLMDGCGCSQLSTSSSSLRLRKGETEERRTEGETICSQVQVVGGEGNLQVCLPVSLSLGPEEGMSVGKTFAKR